MSRESSPAAATRAHHPPHPLAPMLLARARRAFTGHVHGHSLEDCCASGPEGSARDIDVLEFWSGVASIHRAAQARGLISACADTSSGGLDLLSPHGFGKVAELVLRLKEGGLLWMAPVCSSFAWLRLSQTKRSADNAFMGDLNNASVREGNLGAETAAFLFVLAWARSARPAIVNPTMWKYPAITRIRAELPDLQFSTVHRCTFDDAPHGERLGKKYGVLGTGPWLSDPRLVAKCTCPRQVHKLMVDRFGPDVRGRPTELAESQSYPDRMGEAIVAACFPGPGVPMSRPAPRFGGPVDVPRSVPRSSRRRATSSESPPAFSRGASSKRARRLQVSTSSGSDAVRAAPPQRKAWQRAGSDSS